MNYKRIFHTLGLVLFFEALCMVLPLICAILYKEKELIVTFIQCIGFCLAAGVVLIIQQSKDKRIYAKEAFIIVGLSWILMSVFGALPFVLSKSIPNFIPALFETVSGFTTTGASLVSNVESLPKSILLWRSFTHWIGGMGVLVFLVALLPMSGGSNLFLVKAESPGPSVSKLVPKVKSSAKILYGIYLLLTIIMSILLCLGGMNLFESLTHTFATAGTGGFGILNTSIAEYSSYIQIVITIFMILFGIDFTVYYFILIKKFSLVFRSSEVKAYLGIILMSSIIICINCYHLFGNLLTSLKHSVFQVAAIITTTGFATVDFDKWPELSKSILVLLMFVGACAGSTGGGIKISRIMIFLKSIAKEIAITIHPKATRKVQMNGKIIEHETVRAVNSYMAAYFAIFFISLLLISIDNFDFTTNFTSVATTLNNVGPGLAKIGPTQNFSIFSPFSLLVFIFNMLAGRLEIFPLLVLFSKHTWKK